MSFCKDSSRHSRVWRLNLQTYDVLILMIRTTYLNHHHYYIIVKISSALCCRYRKIIRPTGSCLHRMNSRAPPSGIKWADGLAADLCRIRQVGFSHGFVSTRSSIRKNPPRTLKSALNPLPGDLRPKCYCILKTKRERASRHPVTNPLQIHCGAVDFLFMKKPKKFRRSTERVSSVGGQESECPQRIRSGFAANFWSAQ